MWILSEKMWFHLKLLFAKNMRKAERALAFRISGSKCPFLTYYCCATVPSLLRTIGPMIIAMTILHRSAGMKGMTQTASAAPTV